MADYRKLAEPSQPWCHEMLEYDPAFDARVTALAFGVWHPEKGSLTADRGQRDWGNRRVIVPLSQSIKQ